MTFALRLKELRENINLSQNTLSQELGVSQGTVGMWETGERTPKLDVLNKIAKYFNVSIDYLVGNTDDKTQGIILDGVYFRIASEAQEAGVPPEDIEKIIELYKKYKTVK